MMRCCVLSLAFLLSSSLSQGASASQSPAIAEATAASIFEHAIKDAETLGDQRWAFTMVYTNIEKDATSQRYRLRFDPRRDEGDRWELIEPPEDTLSKKEKKAFRQISKSNNIDGSLVYNKLSENVGVDDLKSENENTAIFSGKINDDDMPEKVRDALRMEAVLNKAALFVSKISVTSSKPFSPAPGAKVNKMSQVQNYAPAGPEGEVLMTHSSSVVEGKAFFKAFSSNTTSEFSDYERVDAPAFPEDD